MQTKSKSRIITKKTTSNGNLVTRRLPKKRPPTHPGEMLLEEFLKPLEISRSDFAARLGISAAIMNEIVNEKRGITPDVALRLAQVLGVPADFWLGLQQDYDLWHASRSESAKRIAELEPLRRAG
jgi:addiction module HigA family antidote